MDSDLPTPLHIILDRYAIQDGWKLDDISLCSSGNIAVSGHNYRTDQSYVCIYGSSVGNSDSRDTPILLYHKQFTEEDDFARPPRCISFIKPNSTDIVTCRYDGVQVLDYNRDVVLRSREVYGGTTCLSVSEGQIFIGFELSGIVGIYDNDLNEIKSIRFKGVGVEWPRDIAAAADRLYVCTRYGTAIVYSQDSGSILTEYTTGDSKAWSIAVNMQLQIVAVLSNQKEVAVYSINSNNCFVVFDVESGVSRIRISDNGRIVTGNEDNGDVKVYDLEDLVSDTLSTKLTQRMSSDEIKELRKHSNILDTEKEESSEYSHATFIKKNVKLLKTLKETGCLYRNKANELKTPFDNIGCLTPSKFSGPIHLYQKFAYIYADMPQHDQPAGYARRFNDSVSVNPCVFPCHPPKILDEVIIEIVILKNIKVEWNNAEVIWTLDSKKQSHIPMFGTMTNADQIELKNIEDDAILYEPMSLPGANSTPFGKCPTKRHISRTFNSDMKLHITGKRLKEGPSTCYVEEKSVTEETLSQGCAQVRIKEETAESDFEQKLWTVSPAGAHEQCQDTDRFGKGSVDNEFYKEKVINEKGGTLTIPEAGVRLEIEPGALSRDRTIQIKVSLDLNMCPPSSQVLPRLTPLILCEPDGLEFIIPVKLTVPHCAVIQEPHHHKVTVEIGHKNRSTKEWTWIEERVEYCLTRKTCSVFLKHFSGVNMNIDSTEEKMVRVIPYAKLTPYTNEVLLTLWFCNDLESHFQGVIKLGENADLVPLDSYDTFKLRHVKGAESVKVTLKDASNQWFSKKIEHSIHVNSLAGENHLYRDFRLPTISDQDNGAYMYLDLRVTQHSGEKENETPFALRKRISDLRKPFSLRMVYSPCENQECIPSPQENPTDRCFAVPYIDPMKDHEDDVILTLWLCPFESQREKLQCLQKEQKILLKHMVKCENSFALTQKETVTAFTKFLNERWHLTPELKEIETKRIQYGSRAKFQFIGKKKDKGDVDFINLEVHTFQNESEPTPFIEVVEMSQLLYGSRCIEVPKTEDLFGLLNQASNLEASVVTSNLELVESLQCPLSGPSSSSEAKVTSECFPLRKEVKSHDEELKFIFLFLKKELAAKWKDVARYLHVSEGDIDSFQLKYGDDVEECIYKMFLHWKQEKGHEATAFLVKDTLRHAGRKDLSDKIDKEEHLR